MNYAGLGFIVGQKLTSAYDKGIRQFEGKQWKAQSEKKYNKIMQCLVEQYNNYTIKEIGMKVNN